MGDLHSTVTESVTGTRPKPLAPETAGVLGVDWQQLASQAAKAASDMREAAEGDPAAFADRDIQDAAKGVIEASRVSHLETDSRRRSKPKPVGVSRTVTSPRSSSKTNDNQMEF